jgi:hypothetical protein
VSLKAIKKVLNGNTLIVLNLSLGAGVVLSVWCLIIDWTTEV